VIPSSSLIAPIVMTCGCALVAATTIASKAIVCIVPHCQLHAGHRSARSHGPPSTPPRVRPHRVDLWAIFAQAPSVVSGPLAHSSSALKIYRRTHATWRWASMKTVSLGCDSWCRGAMGRRCWLTTKRLGATLGGGWCALSRSDPQLTMVLCFVRSSSCSARHFFLEVIGAMEPPHAPSLTCESPQRHACIRYSSCTIEDTHKYGLRPSLSHCVRTGYITMLRCTRWFQWPCHALLMFATAAGMNE
jgi:hypothetical protein